LSVDGLASALRAMYEYFNSKELKYSLKFGESESDLINCDEMFFTQIEEIVDTILELK
jgi:hypothetical protein